MKKTIFLVLQEIIIDKIENLTKKPYYTYFLRFAF